VSVIEIKEILRLWLERGGIGEDFRLSGTNRKTVRRMAGQRPRPYASNRESLAKLKVLHGLTNGRNPLRFSQTHRLRHTRATELLDAALPIHTAQRYSAQCCFSANARPSCGR
jgi:integrase